MNPPNLSSIHSLADIGLRGGDDMRPTLLRVLTDLYMQKLRHTPDEERHYTELALRLLEAVDVPTRAAVAAQLARHLSPPVQVIQYLVNDLPGIAAPLRSHPILRSSDRIDEAALYGAAAPIAEDTLPAGREHDDNSAADAPHVIDLTIAGELNEQFFTANAHERRLILLNLDRVAPIQAGRIVVSRDPAIRQRLEAAALGRYREDFAKQLAQALGIPREQALRMARDNLGEPIAVAVKALGMQRDVVHRILMFVNPAVGQSVERIHALATLYDEMTAQAAAGMVAIWQALRGKKHAVAKHQPLVWNDEQSQARYTTGARRAPAAPQKNERRNAS